MIDDPRLPDRFWNKVVPEPNSGCWLWTGVADRAGYGRYTNEGRNRISHRFCYEALVGPIPDGLQIDHLCRTKSCCNPDHLEPVTCRVNLLRGNTFQAKNAAKTHCPQGHEYSHRNTYGRRVCRLCLRAADKRHYYSRKAVPQ